MSPGNLSPKGILRSTHPHLLLLVLQAGQVQIVGFPSELGFTFLQLTQNLYISRGRGGEGEMGVGQKGTIAKQQTISADRAQARGARAGLQPQGATLIRGG